MRWGGDAIEGPGFCRAWLCDVGIPGRSQKTPAASRFKEPDPSSLGPRSPDSGSSPAGPSSPSSSSWIGGPPAPPGRRSLDRSWREIFSRLLRRHTELLLRNERVLRCKPGASSHPASPRLLPPYTFCVCCYRALGAPGPGSGKLLFGSEAARREGGCRGGVEHTSPTAIPP